MSHYDLRSILRSVTYRYFGNEYISTYKKIQQNCKPNFFQIRYMQLNVQTEQLYTYINTLC